jgi:uncharacterized protein Yka (UPF0111/DUF47 family)
MAAKTQIVDTLGEHALVLPALLAAALVANERAKYVLTTLQMAANQAESPQGSPPSLRGEREACAITDLALDRSIVEAEYDARGNYHIPGAQRLTAILDNAMRTMVAPFGVAARGSAEAAALHATFKDRLERLLAARPVVLEDMLTRDTITSLTSPRPKTGDSFHILVMDLHKEINRLQSAISTMDVEGAKTYALDEGDRAVVAAFMTGVKRTAPVKFDHPGLGTIAVRSDGELLIQNDLGTTAAHVLVLKVSGLRVTVTHTDIHLPRIRFLQALCADSGIHWESIRSRQAPTIEGGELFYLAFGDFTAPDATHLAAFLEHLGSRIVFLIDWNKARKRLRTLVPNEVAIDILKWAADHDFGHRGFLQLGGERLIFDALEQAIKTPLRYGQPLHEMIGVDVARDYLRFVLQITAMGLLEHQSEALIRDRVRAELFAHFRSAEQRLLAECSRHAGLMVQMTDGLRTSLRQSGAARGEALAEHAVLAKKCETRADEVVKEVRATVRRISGTDIFGEIIETADDAADELEDAAFLTKLLYESAPPDDLPEPLLILADLLADGTQAFRRMMETAQYVHRGGERDVVQRFLESADRVTAVEHQTDERERAVTARLMSTPRDARQLHLLSAIAHHLESAADALSHASLKLRDHVLGDVMFV